MVLALVCHPNEKSQRQHKHQLNLFYFTFFANCLRAHIANSTLQRHDEFTKNINISCDTSCFSRRIVKKN